MKGAARILIAFALLCLLVAIFIKLNTLGKIMPGALPINWAKLADTALLFAIALSVIEKK